MTHLNATLSVEGRRRLVERCQTRPISHVAAEMGISRTCARKWAHRHREFGESGLHNRPSIAHYQPTATPSDVVIRIEYLRRERKSWARRIALELEADGVTISVRTVSRHLAHLGLNWRRFLDPGVRATGNRAGSSRWPRHMVHIDVRDGRPHPRRRRSTGSSASPTPKLSLTRELPLQSRWCTVSECSSPPTAPNTFTA